MGELDKLLEKLGENPNNNITRQEIVDISNGEKHIVTLFLEDRYAQFHDEFTQIAPVSDIPDLKLIVDYLSKEGYDTNSD